MARYRPKVMHEGKAYFFDEERKAWFDEGGKEVDPKLSFRLQGKFAELR